MLIKDIKSYVTENIFNCVPKVCKCGFELEVYGNVNNIRCTNPYCPYHMGARLESMLKYLGVVGVAEVGCTEICLNNNLQHHIYAFLLKPEQLPYTTSYMQNKVYSMIQTARKNIKTINQMFVSLQIEGIGDSFSSIYDNYDNIDDFYKDFYADKDFVRKKTGIKTEDSKNIILLNKVIKEYELFMRDYEKIVEISKIEKDEDVKIVYVCMTGGVKSCTRNNDEFDLKLIKEGKSLKYENRTVFLEEMNKRLKGKIKFVDKDAFAKYPISYLITDDVSSGSSKNIQADKYKVPKISFKDFKENVLKI